MRWCCALSLGLVRLLPLAAQDADRLTLREQMDAPYAALFEWRGRYLSAEVASLRAGLGQERKQQVEKCRGDHAQLETELQSARKNLKDLNTASSSNSNATAARTNLHREISALEHALRNKERECEQRIPLTFAIKLAKVELIAHWPERRRQTENAIEEGRAQERKYGDIEDIGYRKLADDQQEDISLGEKALRQLAASGLLPPQIPLPSVQEYVQNLAARIARNSDLKVPLHVTVLDSVEINAIALPGGFLVLTSGLIDACRTEAELAGIVAQKIAHIAARHATRSSKRSLISKMFVPAAQVATGLLTGGVSTAGAYYGLDYGFQGLGLLADRTLSGSNTTAQKEADQLGIQYAWKAGFDPKGIVSFFDSVARYGEHPAGSDRIFLTKPALGQRLLDAFTEILYLPPRATAIVDSEEFRRAKDQLRRIPS
jgi:hypothetical protein